MTEAVCAQCARPLLRDAPCFACAARSSDLGLPQHIGPYPILREIGSGGMGSVYAGVQHCPARQVAIKVIKDGVFADPALRARFISEREIAGAFEHPNIIRVYDAGEDADGQLYYVMELASRGTLREFLLGESIPIRDAVRLMVEVTLAVDYAHQRGVLHRDLKPDNILIGEDKRARVTDFGVAHLLAADSGNDAQCVGSYPYMAPEQAGPSTPSPAADVYSLGAILYELVHGAPPYAATTRAELLQALEQGPPPALRGLAHGLDYDLEAVIMRALSHDPSARYASAAEFAEDLRRTLGRRAPIARSRSLRGRLVSALTHHAAWFSILVAALSISAVLVFALNQAMLRASLREHAHLRQQTERTANAMENIFKYVAGVSRQLAEDPHTLAALSQPELADESRLERIARNHDLVNSVFLLTAAGAPVAHYPHESESFYQQHFQRRVYFRGANIAEQQGLRLGVFVSPLFKSRARDGLIKLAFSTPVYGPDQQQLGVAVATVALEKLTHEVEHPALTLVAPREVELNDARATNVELVRVDHEPAGQLRLQPASAAGRQLYIANVARTDYAVVASLREPALGAVRYGLMVGVMALVCLCAAALFLLRRARAQHAH